MKREIELLAPGGDVDAIKAAVAAGANAVYCGLDRFNARNRATNISFETLQGILRLAHENNCQVFVTLNILFVNNEMPALVTLLNKLVNTSIDGVIVQDLGLFYLLSRYFKSLKIHASTQVTTHNQGQVLFLSRLKATRVNLSRELNLTEITELSNIAHQHEMLCEVFVHGSNCLSFSGLCYMSSALGGNSGNRGRCSQPCRNAYQTTSVKKDFPLNLKDNSAYFDIKELALAGVDSFKIEGRIKQFHYVYTVVNSWRKQLQHFYLNEEMDRDNSSLYKVFNRDFTNSYLKGRMGKDLFIDQPRNHAALHLAQRFGAVNESGLDKAQRLLDMEKAEGEQSVRKIIDGLSINKVPIQIEVSGRVGAPLKLTIKTPENIFVVTSEGVLKTKGTEALSKELLLHRLKALNETNFFVHQLIVDDLAAGVFIPFKELVVIKNKIMQVLSGIDKMIAPTVLSKIPMARHAPVKTALLVLISSVDEVQECENRSARIYFKLPGGLKDRYDELLEIFIKHPKLIPWFPAVIIGDDYTAAIQLLKALQIQNIVTNNTGVAFEADQMGLKWIAGPYLNLTNSYSLLCLKEQFNCSGAFLSNELSKVQLKGIKKPAGFQIYYSIYHPMVLMTSRACLFHQVSGCDKKTMDALCLGSCKKEASITNLKQQHFYLDKSKGNYNTLLNEVHYLNTDLIFDFPNQFAGVLIDLTPVHTQTNAPMDKGYTIRLFENILNMDVDAVNQLHKNIYPTTHLQYVKGF
ncbi:peptidase U32 family protein [Geofilum sp. OHC36d9]|uniref:peptidase U32 family protein n=1 Tax=Geofilum sp. OHC36d9 TaxID=3458413 RepID=UPI004033D38D